MLLSHRMLLLVWLLSMFQVIIWNIKDFIKVCSFFDVLFFKCRAGFRIYIILLLPEELLMMNSVSFDSSSVRSLLGYNWQIVRYIKCTRLGFYVLIQYERTPPHWVNWYMHHLTHLFPPPFREWTTLKFCSLSKLHFPSTVLSNSGHHRRHFILKPCLFYDSKFSYF